ncbi:MAG TPA: zinc dependent phospholipase C family protein [Clostridia bacterium]|nr:zinc dependent phospholipase C family protein [Clostridia bacterium]
MADVLTHYITAKRFLEAHPGLSPEFARGLSFGSQGPDLFFFGATRGSYLYARSIHAGDPAALFSNLAEDLAGKGELYRGYALGVLLHYFGDRNIHPYVGAYCSAHPSPYVHVFFESAIEAVAVRREFGAPVAAFDYGAAFRRDGRLVRAAYAFWKKRAGRGFRAAYVWRCFLGMAFLTKLFSRAHPRVVRLTEFFGRLTGKPEAAMAHFKRGLDESAMNDERRAWVAPDGPRLESVEDILQRTVADFAREYEAILAGNYRFTHTERFSNGT